MNKINTTIISLEKLFTVLNNSDIKNSFENLNIQFELLNANIKTSSQNLTELKNNYGADWSGPKNWKPDSFDINKPLIRAGKPEDPNLPTAEIVKNVLLTLVAAIPGGGFGVYAATYYDQLIKSRENEKKYGYSTFNAKAFVIDGILTALGTIFPKTGNIVSTYYGLESANGVRPDDYFNSDLRSTRPYINKGDEETKRILLKKNKETEILRDIGQFMEDKKEEDTKRILLRMNEEQKRKNPALEGILKEANQAGISGSQQKQKVRRVKIRKPPKPKTTADEDFGDETLNVYSICIKFT